MPNQMLPDGKNQILFFMDQMNAAHNEKGKKKAGIKMDGQDWIYAALAGKLIQDRVKTYMDENR